MQTVGWVGFAVVDWRGLWCAVWLVFGIGNAALYLGAEVRWVLLANRPEPAVRLWLDAAMVGAMYPFDREIGIVVGNLEAELGREPSGRVVVSRRRWYW